MMTVKQLRELLEHHCSDTDTVLVVHSWYDGGSMRHTYANPVLVIGLHDLVIVPDETYEVQFATEPDDVLAVIGPDGRERQ